MNEIGKVGLLLILLGFFLVGFAALYSATASPAILDPQLAQKIGVAQGLGWILAGIGFVAAFWDLTTSLRDLKTVTPDISAPETPRSLIGGKVSPGEFVCSDCHGDISANDEVCPHCGAAIEGE